MHVMTKESFWTYSFFGLIAGLIAFGIFRGCIGPSYIYNNPVYSDYKKLRNEYEDWKDQLDYKKKELKARIEQRKVEEVIAGIRPHTDLRGSELEGTAEVLHRFNTQSSTMDAKQRAEALKALFLSPDNDNRLARYMTCYQEESSCVFRGAFQVLNDTSRLALLLSGDSRGVLANLSQEPDGTMPARFADVSKGENMPQKTLAKPRWFGWVSWAVFSWFFALTFFIKGFIYHATDEKKWSHPCETFPSFMLGWIMIVGLFPGFLPGYILYAMTLNTQPLIEAVRQKLRPTTFDDEYSEVARKLVALQAQAKTTGNEKLLARIDRALAKVHDGRNRVMLGQLKETLSSVEGLEDTLAGIEEIHQEFAS